MVSKIVKKILGDKEVLCRFTFTEDDIYSPDEYIDMAVKLHGMGVKLDPVALKKKCKIDFIADDQPDIWTPPEQTEETFSPKEA